MARLYMPRPGSVPARAIAYLLRQPPGTEIATDSLATVARFDRKNATAFLQPALRGGALSRRPADPRNPKSPLLWQLGPKAPTQAELDAGERVSVERTSAPVPPVPPRRSVFEARPEQKREAMAAPVPEAGSFMAEWRRLRGEGS